MQEAAGRGRRSMQEPAGQQARRCELRVPGDRVGRSASVRLRRYAVSQVEELDKALTVGDAVVELEDVRGSTAFETFDEDRLPGRSRTIERARQHALGEIE
jgi:hypothetical protein